MVELTSTNHSSMKQQLEALPQMTVQFSDANVHETEITFPFLVS